ncbi:MAG: rRNA maturation RNase YbeY [Candidatus Yanofskybacteria bacterium]|nr:rRNA maturation RNase YbeY [Candidatus Yanofskybacteria bacterium]
MIDLVFKNHTSQQTPKESFFIGVLNSGLKIAKLKAKKVEVSVNLIGESRIKELNKKYRKKGKPTDVLSFPLGDGNGDIFICLSIAKKEAKRENVSIEAKLAQLTVHGFLHLLGYDHERSKKDADKMFQLEEKILTKVNL